MSALAHSTSIRRHARHHVVALKSGTHERSEQRLAEVVVLVPRQHVPLAPPPRKRSGVAVALTLLGVAAIHVAAGWALFSQPAPQKITAAEIPPMTVEFYRPPVEQPPEPQQPKEEPPPPKPVVQKPKPAPKPVPKPVEPEPAPVQEVVAVEPEPTPPPPPAPVLTKASADAGYLRNPAPVYPPFAQDQGWEGSVLLNVFVLPNGKPKAIEILQSSGRKILDDAAIKAVQRWSFVPAKLDEVPVESWVEVPIDFRLQ